MTEAKPLNLEKTKSEIKKEVLEWLYKDIKRPDKYLVSLAIAHAVRKSFERVKSACEFYLRYKDNPELLIEEHPEYEEELMNQFLFKYRNTLDRLTEIQTFYKWKYQEWLFKQVFKEVLKNEE